MAVPAILQIVLLDKAEQELYGDLFAAAKSMGVSDEVQALLDCGCDVDEIEELLYDPAAARDDG